MGEFPLTFATSSDTSIMRAVLGPTNTGKTHLAVERLLAHGTGIIGLPLRLLAREVYDRMVSIKGPDACALITGEERIRPRNARYFACTVEAMPQRLSEREAFDFVAIDEVQLAGDPDRGHVFTERVLHARGTHETMLLGADTMRPALEALDLKIDSEHRERFSQLSYAGPIKITKLPKRSAIVAFSAEEVYAIAELLKRQRGGCAVIMGALSPRTRNSQVELYQSGEVDYIVATDAVGMGLNLDVSHVAFASRRKFDGRQRRFLRADELAQIAGRAGRFRDDGTFGETSDCSVIDEETVVRICEHRFEPLETLNWRNFDLDWSNIDGLLGSLRRPSPHRVLRRAPEALDETTLVSLAQIPEIRQAAQSQAHVRRLWDLCTLPDFRKHGEDAHQRLVSSLAEKILEPGARLQDEWMYAQIERLDRIEGDIDTLQQRLASIRTWTYAANRSDWVQNAETWRKRTRDIEDRLSDALHEGLMQRFVDRRTSALLKALGSEEDIAPTLEPDGRVIVEGHVVGVLHGLVFTPDSTDKTVEGRAVRSAAVKALQSILEYRLAEITAAEAGAFSLDHETRRVMYEEAPIAELKPGGTWLTPLASLLGSEESSPALRERAQDRVQAWLDTQCRSALAPIFALQDALDGKGLSGVARGIAFQLTETGAAVDRRGGPTRKDQSEALTNARLTKQDREALKQVGVRGGRIAAWIPGVLKPAPAQYLTTLRVLFDDIRAKEVPSSASFPVADTGLSNRLLWTLGYLRLGPRAVRADMAERLNWQLGQVRKASETSHFEATPDLAAIIGCPGGEFPDVLRSLGLKPAERDKETNAVTRWRFPSAASKARRRPQEAKPRPVSDSPFAALAELTFPQAGNEKPSPSKKKKRRRKPKKADVATVDAVQNDESGGETPSIAPPVSPEVSSQPAENESKASES